MGSNLDLSFGWQTSSAFCIASIIPPFARFRRSATETSAPAVRFEFIRLIALHSEQPVFNSLERALFSPGVDNPASTSGLVAWPSRNCTVHQLFEQQAAASPAATALLLEDRELSYGDLNERANRLAHHLIRQGAANGENSSVCACAVPSMSSSACSES